MREWRLLVSGSRSWRQPRRIHTALHRVWLEAAPGVTPTLVHGGAKGADQLAAAYARQSGWHVETHHADWASCVDGCRPGHRRVGRGGEYCPNAGHRRNQTMVDLGVDVLVAFWRDHSGGTRDCMRRAGAAGIRVVPVYDCACHPVGVDQPTLI